MDNMAENTDTSLSSFFLTDMVADIDQGAGFLDMLTLDEIDTIRRVAITLKFETGETIFHQGDLHKGIYLIDTGRIKTFYASPAGKEITLAYWTSGHFIGGPEVFGGGNHMWTACALEPSRLSYLPGNAIRNLVLSNPNIALSLIEGLVAKGKCYSAIAQMLGTRSVMERLAQLLLILGKDHNTIDRKITHEQLANIVGSTRQWVTNALARFQKKGLICIGKKTITVLNPDGLAEEIDL
ncbi:MAG: Crp/Fnr family transcriptional regulator [Methyloligellaceae bacterium]